MQRAGQHLPGPFAAGMTNRDRIARMNRTVSAAPARILRLAKRPRCGRLRHRPRGYDAYRDGPSIGVVRAMYSAFWRCSPCRWLSALSEL
jgi:hypothetical protein